MKDAYTVSPGAGRVSRGATVLLGLLLDFAIVIGSYALALYLRFDGNVPTESWNQLAWAGPLIALAYILAYQVLGVYRTAWQYGSVRDALLLALAVAIVTAGILTVNVLLPKRPIPLTVNVISAAFIFLFHGVIRMLPRVWSASNLAPTHGPQQRVLVVGAGDTGQLLAWELRHNRSQPFRPIAFVDDDTTLQGKRVHGIPVLGGRYDIPSVIDKMRIDMVAIALPPEPAPGLQEILALCEPSKVQVRLVPSLADVMEGRAHRGELREITMEDLLAREPMDVDENACRSVIEGRVVMIIGAAGSIGTELTRRVFSYRPSALHLVDMHETGLHELRAELQQQAGVDMPIKPWLASITDQQKLQDVFEASRPQVVFHLAALKHITMVEENADVGFETNVIGTLNVFEAAQSIQAEHVVFISSHASVNPASVYGAAKRIGELLVGSLKGQTKFCAIRLPNVIDARGAVLALFARQISSGGPVRVTDPEVARYFLTINEVAGLVVQAAALSNGGELFLLDVGEEVRIGELAERLIRSRGMEPGKDIEIIYTGLRPGEKLRENMTGAHEFVTPSGHPRLQVIGSDLSFSGAELVAGIRELDVDRKRRSGNLVARLHTLARFDQQAAPQNAPAPHPQAIERLQEP